MRGGLPILLALAAAAAGCGARGSLSADGAAPLADATTPFVESGPPACTPGEDQTCNDDPAVSALWGTCSSPGYCVCTDGFSVHPSSGRCRPGTLCVASGADPWAVSIRLDATDCAARPQPPCAGVAPSPSIRATAEIAGLAMGTCSFPANVHLRVELVSGCPTILELDRGPSDPSLLPCLEKVLSKTRTSCADDTGCVLFEWDTR